MRYFVPAILAVTILAIVIAVRTIESPAKNVATYFRMVTSVTVDNTEPIDVDVVVKCGWTVREPLGSARYYFPVLAPYIYGVKTAAGHGVLVRTVNACVGDYAKRVPADFLPLVLWAEKAKDLEFLTAYTSEEGYEHPSSRLKLRSVRVSPATEDEYAAWSTSAPKNIVPDKDPFEGDASEIDYRFVPVAAGQDATAGKYGPIECRGLVRYPIPEAVRPMVKTLWPSNRPRFWTPMDWVANNFARIEGAVSQSPSAAFRRFTEAGQYGLLRKNGGGSFYSVGEIAGRLGSNPALPPDALPLDAYPIDADFSFFYKRAGGVRTQRETVQVSLTNDAPRGQMYCCRWPDGYWIIRQQDKSRVDMTFDMKIGDGKSIESKVGPKGSPLGLIVIEQDRAWFMLISIAISTEGTALR